MAEAAANSSEEGPDQKPQLIYRCKKCRRIVAAQEHVVSHAQGKGEASFRWRKRSTGADLVTECAAIFVEPLKWMQTGMLNNSVSSVPPKVRSDFFFQFWYALVHFQENMPFSLL